jgi:hypothetical protein
MSAQNGIVGESFATDIPQTNMPEQDLQDEKRMAKFSRTKEFGVLKAHLEDRIAHYQGFLPDGRHVTEKSVTGDDWIIANTIIAEFKAVINAYEQAAEIVKESV